jgi:hypothetical protein
MSLGFDEVRAVLMPCGVSILNKMAEGRGREREMEVIHRNDSLE